VVKTSLCTIEERSSARSREAAIECSPRRKPWEDKWRQQPAQKGRKRGQDTDSRRTGAARTKPVNISQPLPLKPPDRGRTTTFVWASPVTNALRTHPYDPGSRDILPPPPGPSEKPCDPLCPSVVKVFEVPPERAGLPRNLQGFALTTLKVAGDLTPGSPSRLNTEQGAPRPKKWYARRKAECIIDSAGRVYA
jgi:hypothetical protein